ncbi:MAG: hypothetical protein WA129_05990, partial [Acidovorax sp.]
HWRAHCVVATRLCGIATRHSQRLALHPASARHKRDIGNFRIPYRSTDELSHLWRADRRFVPTLSAGRAQELMARWEHAVRQATLD